jgi:ELWxxDGT repeat protein
VAPAVTPLGMFDVTAIDSRGRDAWFLAVPPGGPTLLHRTDGTPAGTVPLPASLPPYVQALHALKHGFVLRTQDGLLRTDGQQPAVSFAGAAATVRGRLRDVLFYDEGGMLHATDGSAAGTMPIALANSIEHFVAGAEVAWFVSQGTFGRELHRTDGTLGGTTLAGGMLPQLRIERLVAAGDELFAVAALPTVGRELFRFDAAAQGLVLVADLAPGVVSGVVDAAAVGIGGTLLLTASNGADGTEPYVTDGTAAGTRRLADLNPGPGSSNPRLLAVADRRAFFLADDGVHGSELWTVDLGVLGAAHVQQIAVGCAGIAGYPTLEVNATPRLGTAGFAYGLHDAAATSFAGLVLGTDLATGQALGCPIAVGGTTASVLAATSPAGAASFALPLPQAPWLLGLRLTGQAFVLDAAAANGIAGSNGLVVVVGS